MSLNINKPVKKPSIGKKQKKTPKWGRNERKLLVLVAIQTHPNLTINELHDFMHQAGQEYETVARSTLEKLLTRYRLGGLLKRKKTEKLFQTLNRSWKGSEYRYLVTERGLDKIRWLFDQQKGRLRQRAPAHEEKLTFEDLLFLMLLQKKKKGKSST